MSWGGVSLVAKVDELVICGKSKCIGSHGTAIWYSRCFDHADYRVPVASGPKDVVEKLCIAAYFA